MVLSRLVRRAISTTEKGVVDSILVLLESLGHAKHDQSLALERLLDEATRCQAETRTRLDGQLRRVERHLSALAERRAAASALSSSAEALAGEASITMARVRGFASEVTTFARELEEVLGLDESEADGSGATRCALAEVLDRSRLEIAELERAQSNMLESLDSAFRDVRELTASTVRHLLEMSSASQSEDLAMQILNAVLIRLGAGLENPEIGVPARFLLEEPVIDDEESLIEEGDLLLF